MLFCAYASGRDYTQSPQGQAIGALVEKDWETYKDVAALILSRWIAGEHGRRYANLIQESATAEVTRAFMSAVDGYDVTELLREVSCPSSFYTARGYAGRPWRSRAAWPRAYRTRVC